MYARNYQMESAQPLISGNKNVKSLYTEHDDNTAIHTRAP